MQAADQSLLAALRTMPDPRRRPCKRHSLTAMLTLARVAMCCGQQTYSAIADWGRTYAAAHPGWAAARGFTRAELPCAATFVLLFRALDRQAFEAVVAQWAEALLATQPPASGSGGVAPESHRTRTRRPGHHGHGRCVHTWRQCSR